MTATVAHRGSSAALSWVALAAYPLALALAVVSLNDPLTGPAIALPVVVLGLPAILLPRWPLVGFVLLLFGVVGLAPLGPTGLVGGLQAVVLDVAVAYLAATRSRLAAGGAAVTALVAQVAAAALYLDGGADYVNVVIALLLGVVVAWLAGTAVRQRRDYNSALLSRAAAEAVTKERLQIARDLHDQVAHSIGVIAIQAGVGRRVIETQPEEARKALDTIETASRETLAGLRRTLVALRRSDDAPAATPGLAELGQLVTATEAAGVRAEVRISGEQRALPADIDVAAYRIIQEALTNVVRHAQTTNCTIIIEYALDVLTIVVSDAGRGGTDAGTGYGLPGMRERAALLGGELTAGPRAEGGFEVRAVLPIPADAP
ncbi:sensor histidine kinase [Asanoa sp. WMMD1127]|uniref:sensor histidine kinase n=1 Tax=Asanoa sp. WMMD1127 TaxID=3016107 RepID=UPI002417CA8B|nr:sensor histidine kinase [Asanoa sp. WMMD1127]MDG4821365.1 sensor histidine kinase [Asanoa sp. WMMD1127]